MTVGYRSQKVITEVCASKLTQLYSTGWVTFYTLQNLMKLK